MSKSRWVLVVVGATVFLLAVGVLGGGVYCTVNLGRGGAYLVNRFTGRRFPVGRREPEVKLDPATEAIDLVKLERADRFFADGDSESVDDYVRRMAEEARGRVRTLGWEAEREPDGLYVVTFRAQRPGTKVPTRGLGWEVDVEHRIVRFINDDPELAKYYGFGNPDSSAK
jgi:hypothetical protein